MFLPMVPGVESEEKLRLLFSFNDRFSVNTKDALILHFTTAMPVSLCAPAFGIKQPNLSRSIKRLNEINDTYEKLKELEIYRTSDIENQPTQGDLK